METETTLSTTPQLITTEQRESLELALAVLDSLSQHIAIVNNQGIIVAVNKAWRDFAHENDNQHLLVNDAVGTNYFDVCKTSIGDSASQSLLSLDGMLAVLRRESTSFEVVYPCHSPTEERWFMMRVVPLEGAGFSGLVVSHTNITRQKREMTEEVAESLQTTYNNNALLELSALASLTLEYNSITDSLDSRRLKDEAPKLFRELTHQYGAILLRGIEEQAFKIPRRASQEIEQFAERVGFMRLQARDMIDLHTAAIRELTNNNNHPQKHQALISEGRIRLVELMGCVAMYFRDLARGKNGQGIS